MHDQPVVHEGLAADGVEVGVAAEGAQGQRVADAIRLERLQQKLCLQNFVVLALDAVGAQRNLEAESIAGGEEPEFGAGIALLLLVEALDLAVLDDAGVVGEERTRRIRGCSKEKRERLTGERQAIL